MKNIATILTLILIGFEQSFFAQSISKFEIKFGGAFSQFPTSDKIVDSSTIQTIKINPAVSPLFGISKCWTIKNHLELTTGVEFQKTGTRKYSLIQDLLGTITEYTESWEYLRTYKICFPVFFGYAFNHERIKPLVYAGFRPNFIFSGGIDISYHSHFRIDDRYSGDEDAYSEANSIIAPHKLLMNQYTIGISISPSKHIDIELNYNLGYNYYEIVSTIGGSTYSRKVNIPSSDYTISLHYKFLKRDKKL